MLHVGKFYAPFAGGIESFMRDLMRAQQRQGLAVAAVVHHHQPGLPTAREEVEGTPLWRVRSFGRLLYTPLSPTFRRALVGAMAAFQPDLLHLHLPNPSAFAALTLPAARRLPWVVHWHSDVVASRFDWRLALAYRLYRPLEQRLLARSLAILATSPPYLESSPALASHRDRCRVVPLGVDPARLPEPGQAARAWARAQWGEAGEGEAGGLRVLAIGRLTYYKGFAHLIEAAAACPRVRVCIAGRGELEADLRRRIDRLGLGGRVRLLGFVEDEPMRGLLAECDVFCLPSVERSEAFGVVLMEAMRYGRPVVASAIPGSGVGWVARHEDNALTVPPGDSSALAAALRRLAEDQALRKRLGAAGRDRFKREFDIDQVARRVGEVYTGVKA